MNYTFFTQISNLGKHDCSYSCVVVPLVFWRAGSALPITLSELVEDNNGGIKAGFLCHCCWKPAGHSTPQWSGPANDSVVSFPPITGSNGAWRGDECRSQCTCMRTRQECLEPIWFIHDEERLEQREPRCRPRSVEEPLRKEGVTPSSSILPPPLKVSWRYLCLTSS